jgi:hypothetical protein
MEECDSYSASWSRHGLQQARKQQHWQNLEYLTFYNINTSCKTILECIFCHFKRNKVEIFILPT